jgi:protein-disulfide isomerase
VLHQIASKYIDTGKAKVVYHNFVAIGSESMWAAESAECAGEQGSGKFWEFTDYLFQKQNGENQGAFSKDKLKGFAADLKLDTGKFGQCLDSGKYQQALQDETAQGRAKGVQATPTFIINGQLYPGLLTSGQFSQIIDNLAK